MTIDKQGLSSIFIFLTGDKAELTVQICDWVQPKSLRDISRRRRPNWSRLPEVRWFLGQLIVQVACNWDLLFVSSFAIHIRGGYGTTLLKMCLTIIFIQNFRYPENFQNII